MTKLEFSAIVTTSQGNTSQWAKCMILVVLPFFAIDIGPNIKHVGITFPEAKLTCESENRA